MPRRMYSIILCSKIFRLLTPLSPYTNTTLYLSLQFSTRRLGYVINQLNLWKLFIKNITLEKKSLHEIKDNKKTNKYNVLLHLLI